ncbi:MAG: ROK family transcriptional regulator [Spirochaetia bacterium]|nr:ROK family transcriptional regulator [Spirochaetia bacterium]
MFKKFVDFSEIRVTPKSVYLCIHTDGPISKNEIRDKLGSSIANISRFLQELESSGMILKSEGRGRLSGKYTADPDAAYAFGGYINSDVIGLGLCNVTGRVLKNYEVSFAEADTPEKALEFFAETHKKLLPLADTDKVLGSSISIVGPMDKKLDTIINPPDMPKWGVVPFKAMYERAVSAPMTQNLFAEAILLGEIFFRGRDLNKNVILFWLDEGIGASVSHKGRMDLDLKDNSMILGHQIVDFNGIPCHCGKRGCLINYGSIHSFRHALLPYIRISDKEKKRIEELHRDDPWSYSTDLEISELAYERNRRSLHFETFMEDFEKAYFAALWNTFNGIRPNEVIFCGRIASYFRKQLQRVVARIKENNNYEASDIDVHWVDLDSRSLIQGSSARVFNNYLNFVE